MRKLICLGVFLTILVYIMPVGIQYISGKNSDGIINDILAVSANAENTDEETIKVLVDGKVQTLPLDQYIYGVVASEISPDFPVEAIKAQAVAARTYAVYKIHAGKSDVHPEADVCDDFHHCAAYEPLATKAASWSDNAESYEKIIVDAVNDTKGQVITYEDKPIIAVFNASSSDITESAKDVWGSDIPYLTNVSSKGGEACPKYKATVTFSDSEFRDIIQKAVPSADLTGEPKTWFKASERSEAGGVKKIKLGGVLVAGTDIRETLGLNSTNFTISTTDNSISFHTTGYGHGVGLSQYGAKYMAEQGKTYEEILTHYYKDTKIQNLDNLNL